VTRVLLLPSPLLPRLVHRPFLDALARALGARGSEEGAVDVATFPRPPGDPGAVVDAFRRRVADVRPDLVLTHSNAGRYAAAAAPGVPVVHLDATLPAESGVPTPMAPAAAADALAGRADADGLLPPWSRWWGDEELASLLPDAQSRRELHETGHAVPLAYLRSELGAPYGWVDAPQAYVAFGGTRTDEVALARRHGWPVTVLAGAGHLHHVVAPDEVAAVVLDLAARL
jgi:hypothetical protein